MSIVTFVLRLTPYGIIAIMVSTIATSDFAAIWTLGKFMIASYAALLTMYVIHLIILAIMGINPIRYVKTLEVLIFAFTSRSSAGALPLNVQTQTQRLEYLKVLQTSQLHSACLLAKMDVLVFIQQCLLLWLLLLLMLT